jgi:hypothetical protein
MSAFWQLADIDPSANVRFAPEAEVQSSRSPKLTNFSVGVSRRPEAGR